MSNRFVLRCCIVAMVAVLAGCAARQLHQDGVSLINEGRYELGLGKLEEAVKRDSADTQFRMSLYANRERVIAQLLADAEKAMAAGNLRGADTAYRRALAIAPQDVRIAEGIRLLEKRDIHGEMAKQAQAALKNGDTEQAEYLAQKILSVDARHAQALDVRAHAERARAKEAVIPPQLK